MNGNAITIVGNLGADPELRFTPNGIPVAALNVGVTERRRNSATNEWEDSGTSWFRVIVWNQMAENVAESLTRGMRVMVSGPMRSRAWETPEGEKRISWELTADEIGPTLRNQTMTVQRATRASGQSGPADPWAAETSSGPQSDTEPASGAGAAEPATVPAEPAEPGSGPTGAGSGRGRGKGKHVAS